MTCLQEILLRLALAIRAVRNGELVDADHHLREVFRHLESHGAEPGVDLVSCLYEELQK